MLQKMLARAGDSLCNEVLTTALVYNTVIHAEERRHNH